MPDDRWMAGDAYEAYMGRWSRPLAREFVEWLRIPAASHWMDLGCGTGALTTAIVQHGNPASVVACDPAAPFIARATAQLADPRVTFTVAGADDMPRRDGGFDVVVSALVLNFLPDPAASLAAMRGRLRPGGVIAATLWDYADGMAFLRAFWDEARAAEPAAADLDEGRRFPLCRAPALLELFRGAGLADVDVQPLVIETAFDDFDDYWTPFLRGTGPAPGYVASLDDARREALRARLARRLPAGADGRIRLTARAWAVRGTSRIA